MNSRRVVITGMGMLTPVGLNVEETWRSILAGVSGVGLVEDFDTTEYPTKIWAKVKNFNVENHMPIKDARKMDVFTQYGMAAADEAMLDSGLKIDEALSRRIGVAVGAGIGGIQTITNNQDKLVAGGPRKVSPFFIPAGIINMVAGQISIKHNLKGPNISVVTACTTGTHNIGLAGRIIAYGDADVMICGGAEMTTTPLCLAGFSAVRSLSKRNDEPEKASRPWDKDRDGFVMGEGAGILVLEEYEHAKARGAKIYAELVGFGMSGDAYHITAPDEDADGASRAMEAAIQDAGIDPRQVDYINAHGTSTYLNDLNETKAIKRVFENHAYDLAVSSTKSMTGHLLGAAGAVEAIISILAIRDQVAPPTINLDNPDEGCDLNYVAHVPQSRTINYVLSNSLGFGGTNGSLLFKRI
ncbi:TPA: beta-ketoacyl-ACP synthase II [Legionella pneumophila subsp. pneumophila]|uniref:3-oxoacyl-[acyl-carrier-protein] synthase 2 n=1 Tax=Legionella pneumophila (strain Lens) TaxID=297245 RepID=Q5WWV1_LEGPL|nr:beta-ketoacyl-ACP synthase II [Legionella pneumophila]AOW52058.1 beta-ketoacyl-[acyl-carrier-protein] synthase II [Legionella pneumophila subsp. pneumophila]AOW54351.1 beta-ketoacyl-[acyl-carrier-protein] synthase II [Legionella pneumophila subsp. pneumophila]AOW57354.1 beta-ketoacyl-[acyl-carrier-protein] synthase II [Legionella pneumophila subsp. pneumophila]AOW59720.1 beta-ketoacyl-[acyl-carrier-protein] synthase II [Legionella pneumophila subsp. pneumophila]AOW62853.1 beta-ketoacyl-[acy